MEIVSKQTACRAEMTNCVDHETTDLLARIQPLPVFADLSSNFTDPQGFKQYVVSLPNIR